MKRPFSDILLAITLIAALLFQGGITPASAGSAASSPPQLPLDEVKAFSNTVQRDLAARNAHIAIVARVGRDPDDLPNGISFTHVAFWVLSDIPDGQGGSYRGYRAWNLYQNAQNPDVSALIQDGPVDFFAGVAELRAGVIIPSLEMQERLLKTLASPAYADMHNPNYSVLANPNNNQYQNCTEHLLNVVMASVYGTADMAQIKSNTKTHFAAQPVELSPLARSFGPVFVKGVSTDDHKGALKTTTFGSIARFMDHYRLSEQTYTLRFDG